MSTEIAESIDERVSISLAISRYINAREKFEKASKEFSEACQDVRVKLPKSCKFITKQSYMDYLVETDESGDFEIEPISSI